MLQNTAPSSGDHEGGEEEGEGEDGVCNTRGYELHAPGKTYTA